MECDKCFTREKDFLSCATAGSRTRVNGLGSRHDNRYTTVAHAPILGKVWLFNCSLSYSCIISYFGPAQDLILHTEG